MPGGPGRKPIPINLHLLQNPNWRAKKKAKSEYPEPEGEFPEEPPAWLPFTGRQEWVRVVEAMKGSRIYTTADVSALEGYCYWYAQFRELVFWIDMDGYIITTLLGVLKENPAVRMAREASRKCLEFAVQLGLTPSARMKLAGPKKKTDPEDPFAKHEAQGKGARKA
jgi:P27 family predicted phage terminase small subunit